MGNPLLSCTNSCATLIGSRTCVAAKVTEPGALTTCDLTKSIMEAARKSLIMSCNHGGKGL